MAATVTKSRGKSGFVKEFLIDNPQSNPVAVNKGWKAAGMKGTISPSLINKIRSELGLVGNISSGTKDKPKPGTKKPKSTGKKRGRKSVTVAATEPPARASKSSNHQLTDLDADLDHLIFKVMTIGSLPRVEESLRATRRVLYSHSNGRNG